MKDLVREIDDNEQWPFSCAQSILIRQVFIAYLKLWFNIIMLVIIIMKRISTYLTILEEFFYATGTENERYAWLEACRGKNRCIKTYTFY